MNYNSLFIIVAIVFAPHAVSPVVGAQPAGQPKSFPVARVLFEQNATDMDVEVVFEVTGRAEGLTTLKIEAPDGRMVADFASAKAKSAASGIRQFVFESPEPQDVASLKAAFPEGVYTFEGLTKSGVELRGTATLNHKLPATSSFVVPKADARDVPASDLYISWAPVPQLAAYIIELEQEELDMSITAKLPASSNSFAVPNGFLRPATEYKLGVGTVSKNGNVSFVETSFTTGNSR